MSRPERKLSLASIGHSDRDSSVSEESDIHTGVQVGPVMSAEERKLLAGTMIARDYIQSGQEESEELVRRLMKTESERRRALYLAFAGVASVVYLATAVVFLILDSTSASVSALAVSVAFLLLVNMLFLVHRR